jgi:hypothetical protein
MSSLEVKNFFKHLFHSLNNSISLTYGKLELISLFPKPEYLEKLNDAEIDLLFRSLESLHATGSSEDPFMSLKKTIENFKISSKNHSTASDLWENEKGIGKQCLAALSTNEPLRQTVVSKLKEIAEMVGAFQEQEKNWKEKRETATLHAYLNQLITVKTRLEEKIFP